MSSSLRPALILVLSASLALLAGCGGDDEATDSTTSTTEDTTTTTTDTDEGDDGEGNAVAEPTGSYEIEVPPEWEAREETPSPDVEVWDVPTGSGEAEANVNVVVRALPNDFSLQDYLDVSAEQTGSVIQEYELIRAEMVQGEHGQVGIHEYEGERAGEMLRFVGVMTETEGGVALATFAAPPEKFDELYPEVEPHLMSLRGA